MNWKQHFLLLHQPIVGELWSQQWPEIADLIINRSGTKKDLIEKLNETIHNILRWIETEWNLNHNKFKKKLINIQLNI